MKTKVATAIMLVIASTIAYILYISVESYQEEIDPIWSKKALLNPYLAAEQYLQLRGQTVSSSSQLHVLEQLRDSDVLLISDSRQIFNKKRVDELVEWMKQGGRLIVGAKIAKDEGGELFLSHFNLKIQISDCDCKNNNIKKLEEKIADLAKEHPTGKLSDILREANKELKKNKGNEKNTTIEETVLDSQLAKLTFENVAGELSIHFPFDYELKHPALIESTEKEYLDDDVPIYWQSNEAGIQYIQMRVGQGLLNVVTDTEIWHSKNIDLFDHAYLLSILAGGGKALILYGMQMPSIFNLLGQHAPELCFSLFVWLIMWLIYNARRFGPVREINITVRRSLEEHLKACGELLWGAKKADALLNELHSAINRKIKNYNPNYISLDKAEKIDWLSQKCELSKFEIEQALFIKQTNDEEHFYKIVRLSQEIGKKL